MVEGNDMVAVILLGMKRTGTRNGASLLALGALMSLKMMQSRKIILGAPLIWNS